ncbi:hypothetical protein L1D15_21755 [Vibrio sp. Isolate25]|uniref:hypothetical protein n=1 Tax=Vibrio sp. Isolate25 TaxID=2908535 RepID=UPI001EFEE510|nr:hypothetical protein [Vibrio sp. Isolate25]MCG9599315.1 hypothetical protein [Vibrio sp. Isolate25]
MMNILPHQIPSKYKWFILLFYLLPPSTSFAHVQWFVSPEEMKQVSFAWDWVYYSITLLVCSCALLGVLITRYSNRLGGAANRLIAKPANCNRTMYSGVFSSLTVLFFLLLVVKGGFIAPNINLPSEWITTGVILQGLIVLSACISISFSGLIILLTTGFMALHIPTAITINYLLEFIAVGMFMLLTGQYVSKNDQKVVELLNLDSERMWALAVVILRIGVGFQLAILAYTEKLAYPGLALVFIEMFPFYNFFPSIGLSVVSDLHFVYFIGLCELLLGLLLAFGFANRLVMVMLAFAFVTTSLIHGAHEIEGHLPIFAAAFVLLLELYNRPKALRCRLAIGLHSK